MRTDHRQFKGYRFGSLQQTTSGQSQVGVGWFAWGGSRSIKYVVYAYKIWYYGCVVYCVWPCFKLHLIIYQAFVVTLIRGGRNYQLFHDNLNEAPYGRDGNRS